MSPKLRNGVRYFVDYFPLAAFLAAYFLSGRSITMATWAIVAGSAVALLVGLILERRLAPLPLIAGGAALVFGGASLFFHDPRILKIKPTVMNGLFAVLLLGGLALGRNPLKLLFADTLEMPPSAWRQFTLNYASLFAGLAILNELIWRTQPESIWVLYRFPGMMLLTVLFSVAHAPFLMRHMKVESE